MKLLLLDSGNSRLKWAVLSSTAAAGARFQAQGSIPQSQLATRLPSLLRRFEAPLRIVACNVAGARAERVIRRGLRTAQLPRAHWVRSARAAGGVRNGYTDVWRLGADRWAAMIGARAAEPKRALCIVSIGTALTVDLLRADGRHVGGCIAAGPGLMVQALLTGTAGIRRRARGAGTLTAVGLFARRTDAALQAGARYAAAALIDRAMREARTQLGVTPRLWVGGGAADEVLPLLRSAARRRDDLVLRGLQVLARTER